MKTLKDQAKKVNKKEDKKNADVLELQEEPTTPRLIPKTSKETEIDKLV